MTEQEIAELKSSVFSTPANPTVMQPQFQQHAAVAPQPEPTPAPTNQEPTPAAAPTNEPSIPAVDYNTYIKEKFGYDSEEVLKQELEKAKTPAQYKFLNEESERIAALINEGREDEVHEVLSNRRLVKEFENKTDDQKLKLWLKAQNPKLDSDLLDYKFNTNYTLDTSKFTDEDGNVDVFKERLAKAELSQRIEDDVVRAAEHFSKFKSKIDLPNTTPPAKDEDYENWKQLREQTEAKSELFVKSVEPITEKDVTLNMVYQDQDNKFNIEVQITPDKADFETAKQASLDYSGFIQSEYTDANGNFNSAKLIQDILFAKQKEKYLQSAVKQGANGAIKWQLAREKQTPSSTQRSYAQVEVSELDNIKKSVFGK